MRGAFFWVIIGVGIGVSLGVAFNNIPAGISLGAGCGMLMTVFSIFKNEGK